MSTPHLGIVIPVHNCLGQLEASLPRLRTAVALFEGRASVILVDDGSADGTSSWVKETYPDFTVIEEDGRKWWSGAVNVGARYAANVLTANFLLLWNADILCSEDYFSVVSRLCAEDRPRTIFASKLFYLDPPDRIFSFGCTFDSHTGRSTLIGCGEVDGPRFASRTAVHWAGGMGTLVPMPIAAALGFWDEVHFPQYHGDSDFCLRAREIGIEIVAVPELRIWNDKRSSGFRHELSFRRLARSFTDRRSLYHLRTNLNFYRRHVQRGHRSLALGVRYGGYVAGFARHYLSRLIRKPTVRPRERGVEP